MSVNTTTVAPGWRALQYFAVAAAVALIVILLISPTVGLFIAWNVLIPLVPVMLLVAPMLWRNVCPIGVVGQIAERLGVGRRRRLPRWLQRWATTISIVLLFALVPLRLVLFNSDAVALVALMVVAIAISLVGGMFLVGKGAWCATFCPVLPVERLYGQSPLVNLPHAHCKDCAGCVGACFDLIPSRSLSVLSGLHERNKKRTIRPMAIFAIAFPGFVLGYFTPPANASALVIYLWIFLLSAASATVFAVAQYLLKLPRAATLRVGAALAISIYYWFTIPAIAVAVNQVFHISIGGEWLINGVRALLLGVIAIWLVVAFRRRANSLEWA
ncbi:MAG: hypothetical protein IT211_15700 [Armatimonadetes bacterium]|nr:hypothetical protein [Armatimonadota bacterium]